MSEISEEMRTTEVESRDWYMAAYAPESAPTSDHLELRTIKISLAYDSIPDQHVVLETLFLSLDPYLRSRMTGREDGLCSPQYNLNEFIVNYYRYVLSTFGVGKVIRSEDSNFGEGDIVLSPSIPIAECSVLPCIPSFNK